MAAHPALRRADEMSEALEGVGREGHGRSFVEVQRMAAARQHHFVRAGECKVCWPVPSNSKARAVAPHTAVGCDMKDKVPELGLRLSCPPSPTGSLLP